MKCISFQDINNSTLIWDLKFLFVKWIEFFDIMKCDLGFNYDKAMKRQNHSQNEINELRSKLNHLDSCFAKSLTNKQVLEYFITYMRLDTNR